MSTCQDCKKELEYGRHLSGVCHPCRAIRANKVRRDREKASGRTTGTRRKEDW